MISVMPAQPHPNPCSLRWKLGEHPNHAMTPKAVSSETQSSEAASPSFGNAAAVVDKPWGHSSRPRPATEATPPGTVSRRTEAISQTDRNVTDKNVLPCFWGLSTRGEVWPVWPGAKAQTGGQWEVTERGQICMVVSPRYKLELVLLEHFLLKPSQQSRVGQRWMTKPFNRDQSLPEEHNVQGKPKNRATCSLCIMTCRFSFLHDTRGMLKEEPLQDMTARSFEWQAVVCSPQSTVLPKY